jgi:hypothetical protein
VCFIINFYFYPVNIFRNKTEGIWIGKLKNCKDKIRGIKWTQNPVKALGIFFGHNKEECQKLNWEKKIEEMKNQFTADILIMCTLSSIFTFIPLIFLFSLSLNAIISTEITNKRADKGHLDRFLYCF